MRPGQRAQRVDQRRQRQALGAQLHALPGEHQEPRAGRPLGQLPDQPGLADPGLAADDRERGLLRPGPVHQRAQRRQLRRDGR